MRKILVEFAMSNTTVRWTLTTVHRALGAKLQSVTIGSMYSVLASLQKIQKASVNGFVKITIQLKNQTIKESLKKVKKAIKFSILLF